jgi:plasmid stabilization system protein ParE
MKPVILRARAERNLEDVQAWYEREQPGLGLRFLAHFEELLQTISLHPQLYARLEKDVRRAPRVGPFPYSVYYRDLEGRIIVLTVVHNSRYPDTWRSS